MGEHGSGGRHAEEAERLRRLPGHAQGNKYMSMSPLRYVNIAAMIRQGDGDILKYMVEKQFSVAFFVILFFYNLDPSLDNCRAYKRVLKLTCCMVKKYFFFFLMNVTIFFKFVRCKTKNRHPAAKYLPVGVRFVLYSVAMTVLRSSCKTIAK